MNGWVSVLLGILVVLSPIVLFVSGVVWFSLSQYRADREQRRIDEVLTEDRRASARADRNAAYNRGVAYGRATAQLAETWGDEEYADPGSKNRWELLSDG